MKSLNENKIIVGKTILIIVVVCAAALAFTLYSESRMPLTGGMRTLQLKVEYFESRTIENITTSSNIVFADMSFSVFFQLNKSKRYWIYYEKVEESKKHVIEFKRTEAELYFFRFNNEGYIGLVEVVQDMCLTIIYDIGMVHITVHSA